MVLIFAGTNFGGNFFSGKNCISRVLIFAVGGFKNFSQVFIFAVCQKVLGGTALKMIKMVTESKHF